jgi:hypothetical protein
VNIHTEREGRPIMSPRAPGRLELLAGKISAKLIVFAATRAAKRGDTHELNHLVAAITAGNKGR